MKSGKMHLQKSLLILLALLFVVTITSTAFAAEEGEIPSSIPFSNVEGENSTPGGISAEKSDSGQQAAPIGKEDSSILQPEASSVPGVAAHSGDDSSSVLLTEIEGEGVSALADSSSQETGIQDSSSEEVSIEPGTFGLARVQEDPILVVEKLDDRTVYAGSYVTMRFGAFLPEDTLADVWIGYNNESLEPTDATDPHVILNPQPPAALWQHTGQGTQLSLAGNNSWLRKTALEDYPGYVSVTFEKTFVVKADTAVGILTVPTYLYFTDEPLVITAGTIVSVEVSEYIVITDYPSRYDWGQKAPETKGAVISAQKTVDGVVAEIPANMDSEYATLTFFQKDFNDDVMGSITGETLDMPGSSETGTFTLRNNSSTEYEIVGINVDFSSTFHFNPRFTFHPEMMNTILINPAYRDFYANPTNKTNVDGIKNGSGGSTNSLVENLYEGMEAKDPNTGGTIISGYDRLFLDTYSANGILTKNDVIAVGKQLLYGGNNGRSSKYFETGESVYTDFANHFAAYSMRLQFGTPLANGFTELKGDEKYRVSSYMDGAMNQSELLRLLGEEKSIVPGDNGVHLMAFVPLSYGNAALNYGDQYMDMGFQVVVKRVNSGGSSGGSSSGSNTSSGSTSGGSSSGSNISSGSTSGSNTSSGGISSSEASSSIASSTVVSSTSTSSSSQAIVTPPVVPGPVSSTLPSSRAPVTSLSRSASRSDRVTNSATSDGRTGSATTGTGGGRSTGAGRADGSNPVQQAQAAGSGAQNVLLADGGTSLASITIGEDGIPLFGKGAVWALLNLIVAIASLFFSGIILLRVLAGKKEENTLTKEATEEATEEVTEESRKPNKQILLWKIAAIGTGLLPGILFLATENVNNIMVFLDKWTLPTILFAVLQGLFAYMLYRKNKKQPENDVVLAE